MIKSCLEPAAVMLLYAASTVMMKLAAQSAVFSLPFFGFYGLALLLLLAYAVLWQGLLSRLPLITAYSAKGLVIVYGFIAGALFFGEAIRLQSLLAAVLVIGGIYLVASDAA